MQPPESNRSEKLHPDAHEIAPSMVAVAQVVPPISIPLPGTPPVTTQSVSHATPSTDDNQTSAGSMIKDKDLIEKEWVNKAKAIVERTQEDPYKQSEDLTVLKADYMKKQFNKTIKLSN
jgi:hypothetical protein